MRLYNTISRKVEDFVPINDRKVNMYTCGLTVYSQPQIGNWVAYIYSDILHRTLIESGFKVYRVQNITDVGHLVSDDDIGEDKMEKGARIEGITAWDVADKYIKVAAKESKILGLLSPDKLVRATDLITQQIDFVKGLEEKGYTYIIDDGVYFDTSKLDDYGKLAQLDIDGLQAGARVKVGGKKNITDFALWKFSPKDKKRDMEWESPWGLGFPGWHLECSVIARENLGDQIDIHTGGIDHIPVHHTNEIAQTESLTSKKPFSKFWFHNNHIKIDGTKLSKSLGNSYTLSDINDNGFSTEAFRLLVLSSHYQTEGNFSWKILESSSNRLSSFNAMADLQFQTNEKGVNYNFATAGLNLMKAMQNNLDTPGALTQISKVASDLEGKVINSSNSKEFRDYLELIDRLLGFNLSTRSDISTKQVNLLKEREVTRVNKDWIKSDKIREELLSQKIIVNDTSWGQIWHRID
ncbi:cysteine--tRNA ligase [Candidatus Saccharibacteria bacterium]|nr:cysteine--tRNA ligase [Candidatus Saccharibacteria bacterium]